MLNCFRETETDWTKPPTPWPNDEDRAAETDWTTPPSTWPNDDDNDSRYQPYERLADWRGQQRAHHHPKLARQARMSSLLALGCGTSDVFGGLH